MRSAKDAENEDILGIFNVLDTVSELEGAEYSISALDRPSWLYGPEEINLYAVADCQTRMDPVTSAQTTSVTAISFITVIIRVVAVEELGKRRMPLLVGLPHFVGENTEHIRTDNESTHWRSCYRVWAYFLDMFENQGWDVQCQCFLNVFEVVVGINFNDNLVNFNAFT